MINRTEKKFLSINGDIHVDNDLKSIYPFSCCDPGTPALTSRGFIEEDFVKVAEFFDSAVKLALKVKAEAKGLVFFMLSIFWNASVPLIIQFVIKSFRLYTYIQSSVSNKRRNEAEGLCGNFEFRLQHSI